MDSNELIQTAKQLGAHHYIDTFENECVCFVIKELEQFAQRIQPQWMPISTAPKDETILLCKWFALEKTMLWVASGYFDEDDDSWFCDVADKELKPTPCAGFWKPTHWMPILPPPEGDK